MLETEALDSLCSEKQLARMLPLFARLLANDQPASIRTAVQASITTVYSTIGERTVKLLGSTVSEPTVESLLDRLRRAAAPNTSLSASLPAPSTSLPATASASASLSASQRSSPSRPSKVPAPTSEPHPTASLSQLRLKREAPTTPAKAAATSTTTTPAKGVEAEARPAQDGIGGCIADIKSELADSVVAMKRLTAELELCNGVANERPGWEFSSHADELVVTLVSSISALFDESSAVPVRVFKHTLHVLVQMFMRKWLASAVSEAALQALLQELLIRLLDAKLVLIDSDHTLHKALNQLVLKVLEFGNYNRTFTVLLRFLHTDCSVPLSAELRLKFTESILRCMLKMTKGLEAVLPDVDLDVLMRDVHLFLMAHPPAQYSASSSATPAFLGSLGFSGQVGKYDSDLQVPGAGVHAAEIDEDDS
jgi:cytoskeleton-associated protein 5